MITEINIRILPRAYEITFEDEHGSGKYTAFRRKGDEIVQVDGIRLQVDDDISEDLYIALDKVNFKSIMEQLDIVE